MREVLSIPNQLAGNVWYYTRNAQPRIMHRHDELELNLVVRGTARYLFADRTYDLHSGTQIWLFPGQDHLLLDESAHYEMWIVVFRPALVQQLCTTAATRPLCDPNPPGQFCRVVNAERTERLTHLFEELYHVAKINSIRFNAGLGYALLTAWDAHHEALALYGSGVHPAVETVARLIHDQDDEQLASVPALAARVGMSSAHLSRLFRKQTGVSIMDFRNRQRIERFLRLYSRDTSLVEAAIEAGFGSYAQFHRVFKQAMGCGPAVYCRRFLEKRGT